MAIDRRLLLKHAAALPFLGTVPPFAWAAGENEAEKADYTLHIAPVTLELAPGKTIRTTGYNGRVPGPALRLREGRPVTINVINDAGYADIVHWHGLYLPAVQDGATEEGSPIIPVGQSQLYSFTPKPSGTRWYHSHAMAMTDLTRSTYSGEFGFVIIDPVAGDPGLSVAATRERIQDLWSARMVEFYGCTDSPARLRKDQKKRCFRPRSSKRYAPSREPVTSSRSY